MKIQNAKKLISIFFEDAKEFSLSVAYGRLRRDLPIGSWEKRRKKYEVSVLKYLKKNYCNIIEKCVTDFNPAKCQKLSTKQIWVMWWQGEKQMPQIVKMCNHRLNSLDLKTNVTLITEENWRDFIDIPDFVIQKCKEGKMTITQLSDIIRSSLLFQKGGFWIDATTYVENLPKEVFDSELFSLHSPDMFPEFLSRGNWIPGILGCNKSHTLFAKCLYNLFIGYWREHDKLIDYLLVDFFIYIILEKIDYYKALVKKLPENRNFYKLRLSINEEYDNRILNEILLSSPFHVLTYKNQLIPHKEDSTLTNYGYLLKKEGCWSE